MRCDEHLMQGADFHRPLHPNRLSPQQQVAILPGQSGADERRAASEPRCVGLGDGASGSAVVGLDPDAGLTLLSDRGASS